MVVAVFIRQLSLGGAEKQSLLLTRELRKHFPAFLVVWTNKIVAPEYQRLIEEDKLPVVFLKGSSISKFIQFFRLMRSEKVSHLFNFLLINNFAGGLAGRLAGVRKIFGGIRNCDIVPSKLRWQKFLHNHVSHHTIFNNHAGAENLALRGFRKEKMLVIHNGIDVNGMAHKEGGNAKLTILTASRFLPQKDHYTALLAIKELAQKNSGFRYVLAGYGAQEEEIRQWIKVLDIQDYVELLIAPDKLPEIFHKASVYLSTSLREGLSNSLMEALAAELPVVATNVGDNKYLVEEGKNGFLTNVGDVKAIADALARLLDDKELRLKMGRYGYEKLKAEFSTCSFISHYLSLLETGR
ncbi:glycosyltransferase [Marinilabilia sp.]|uniref:glycosyltransferase n=1 Tax=Marinilabilia sp. TaxID=2021252 RepID=UPI0025BF39E0|nr:glycosyltransferase [Marinilabilia sp.]